MSRAVVLCALAVLASGSSYAQDPKKDLGQLRLKLPVDSKDLKIRLNAPPSSVCVRANVLAPTYNVPAMGSNPNVTWLGTFSAYEDGKGWHAANPPSQIQIVSSHQYCFSGTASKKGDEKPGRVAGLEQVRLDLLAGGEKASIYQGVLQGLSSCYASVPEEAGKKEKGPKVCEQKKGGLQDMGLYFALEQFQGMDGKRRPGSIVAYPNELKLNKDQAGKLAPVFDALGIVEIRCSEIPTNKAAYGEKESRPLSEEEGLLLYRPYDIRTRCALFTAEQLADREAYENSLLMGVNVNSANIGKDRVPAPDTTGPSDPKKDQPQKDK